MRLVNPNLCIDIEFNSNDPHILVIENKHIMVEIINGLIEQINGEDGGFVLSNDDKILNINKSVEMIFNPFSIDFNNKRIITKFYSQLQDMANEKFYFEKNEIIREISEVVEKVMISSPVENVKWDYDKSWVDFLKLINVSIDDEYDTLIDKIMNYINLVNKTLGIKLFIFVNLKSFLDEASLQAFYEYAAYNELTILLIEPVQTNIISKEKLYIIDKDLCIIK